MATGTPASIVEPTAGPVGTVILLHGLGSSGDEMEQLVPLFARPDLRFVLPFAPPREVTINQGFRMRAWYDIRGFARTPDREPEEDVREAARQIEAELAAEVARGTPADRIVLAGFSQGGAMAAHVGLTTAHRLAGLVVLSGYLVRNGELVEGPVGGSAMAPAFCAHGQADPQVRCAWGQEAAERLGRDLRLVEWRTYAMGHELCAAELHDLRAWLDQTLPGARSVEDGA